MNKILVTGGRYFNDIVLMDSVMRNFAFHKLFMSTLIQGGANGADLQSKIIV